MRLKTGTRASYILAAGAILAFAVLFAFALVRLASTEAETRRSRADNMLWALSQAHSAALQLDGAVARTAGNVPVESELPLAYDILLSRLSLLSAGPQARYLRELGFAERLATHRAAVLALEEEVDRLGPGDRDAAASIHDVLAPLVLDLGQAANRSMVAQWDATGARQDAISAALVQVIVSIAAILALGAGMIVLMLRAIVAKHKAQHALRHEQEMREAYRGFVDLVSHQFRTPLAIIDSSMQRILRCGADMPVAEVARRAARVRQVVQQLTRLIDSTLEGIRSEGGPVEARREPCDPNALIRTVRARQLELTPDRQIDLRLAPDLPDRLVTDPLLLEQILSNLVSNATKYSPDSEPVVIAAEVEQEQISVLVRDNGIGIAEDEQSLVFNRFFRSKAASGIPGAGLGLDLSRRLADTLGGTLSLQSRPGHGTTFTLRLPLETDAQAHAA